MAVNPASSSLDISGVNAQASSATLFTSISNRNTHVSVNLTENISKNGPNAGSLAQKANAGLSSAQQDISNMRAGMVADVKAAQAEVMEATKAAGHDVQDVFPQSTAPDSTAELVASAAISASGKGSMATLGKTFDAASAIETIRADRARSPEEAKAEIVDVLRSASEPDSLTKTFGHVAQADAPAQMQSNAKVDWNNFCDNHGNEGLDALMAFNPDKPNPDHWPQFAEVDQALAGIEQKMGENANTIFFAENRAFSANAVDAMDTASITARAANVNVPDDAGYMENAATTSKLIGDSSGNSNIAQDLENAAKAMANAANFNNAAPAVVR